MSKQSKVRERIRNMTPEQREAAFVNLLRFAFTEEDCAACQELGWPCDDHLPNADQGRKGK